MEWKRFPPASFLALVVYWNSSPYSYTDFWQVEIYNFQDFLCDCSWIPHLSVPNLESICSDRTTCYNSTFQYWEQWGQWRISARKPMCFPLLPRCHTAGPPAGKAANCLMCAKPQEHVDFYTNTSIIFAVIVKVVNILVICLYSRKYIYFNSFKNAKWKSKTNEMGKTIFCNMWCTSYPSKWHVTSGSLPRCGMSVLKSQCQAHSSKWNTTKHFREVWAQAKTPRRGLCLEATPTHIAMKLNIGHHSRKKLPSNNLLSPQRRGKNLHLIFIFLKKKFRHLVIARNIEGF